MKVILASQSPRRAALLNLAQIDFEVMPSNYKEKINKGMDIEEQAKELAYGKAIDVFNNTQGDRAIIGADTIVVKDKKIYGKPKDRADAIRMLKELQGDYHVVYTSLSILIEDHEEYKEYSELCGNITVVTGSTSSSTSNQEVSFSQQTQVRPLIYPSELQRLNKPGDIGHSIIVTFGNYPLKTYFSPSFKVPFYKIGAMDISGNKDRLFEEDKVYYDITIRNNAVFAEQTNVETPEKKGKPIVDNKEEDAISDNPEDLDASSSDIDDMIDKYREWKLEHPDSSIEEFYMNMANRKDAPSAERRGRRGK